MQQEQHTTSANGYATPEQCGVSDYPETGLVRKRISGLKPSPENDDIYRPIRDDDPEIRQLAASIGKRGLLEPLVVTKDNYILSGHRRHAACRLAGVIGVDCRVENITRQDDPDRFVDLLREFNRQREKTLSEKLREEIISADPVEAHRRLIEHRAESSVVRIASFKLRSKKGRSEISDAKRPMLNAILKVFRERRDFLPLTVRAVHYALLNDPPLKHASKPDSAYKNDLRSYKNLDDLLTRARLAGDVEMDWIRDDTRPVTTWNVYDDAQPFIRDEMGGFLKGYYRDLMQSQPNHIEVLGEKNTVDPILKSVLEDFCVPLTTGRGYSSLPPRAAMAKRFFDSGKEKLILLAVTDFDPDGEEICHSFATSMRDDFGIENIHPIKVALTHKQVRERDLPRSLDAKTGSSNYKKFVKKYGTQAYELESLRPEDLQEILRQAIHAVIDQAAYDHEVEQERNNAAELEAVRKVVHSTLQGLEDFGGCE